MRTCSGVCENACAHFTHSCNIDQPVEMSKFAALTHNNILGGTPHFPTSCLKGMYPSEFHFCSATDAGHHL